MDDPARSRPDRQEAILAAAIEILATEGLAGLSMRAVAKRADVALGLVNYHFDDKASLITAALRRFEAEDLALVKPDENLDPHDQLCEVLRRVVDPTFLTTEYLSLRLQLWALAQADEAFADINARAQAEYRDGLARLITAAVPDVDIDEARRRAADIDIVQNGIWLTALLRIDAESIARAAVRCEEIAFSDS